VKVLLKPVVSMLKAFAAKSVIDAKSAISQL
jgi:hypothetical protein